MEEKEYIEREKLNDMLEDFCVNESFYDALQTIPAADVVPVVRCKDCKHFHNEKILYAAKIISEHADGICALRKCYTDDSEFTNVSAIDFCSCGAKMDGG